MMMYVSLGCRYHATIGADACVASLKLSLLGLAWQRFVRWARGDEQNSITTATHPALGVRPDFIASQARHAGPAATPRLAFEQVYPHCPSKARAPAAPTPQSVRSRPGIAAALPQR